MKDYKLLISKYINGTLTNDELIEFYRLLDTDEHFSEVFKNTPGIDINIFDEMPELNILSNPKFQYLIDGYIDGTLKEDELEELNELYKTNKIFAKTVDDYEKLEFISNSRPVSTYKTTRKISLIKNPWFYAAACITIIFSIYFIIAQYKDVKIHDEYMTNGNLDSLSIENSSLYLALNNAKDSIKYLNKNNLKLISADSAKTEKINSQETLIKLMQDGIKYDKNIGHNYTSGSEIQINCPKYYAVFNKSESLVFKWNKLSGKSIKIEIYSPLGTDAIKVYTSTKDQDSFIFPIKELKTVYPYYLWICYLNGDKHETGIFYINK